MKRIRKSFIITLSLIALCAFSAVPAMAEDAKITGVYLYADLNLEVDSPKGSEILNLYPTTSGHYTITSSSFLNECDTWDKSQTPRIKLQLTANDGYAFDALSSSDITVTGNARKIEKIARENNGKNLNLIISFTNLNNYMGAPTGLRWSTSGVALWNPVSQADCYEVTLYRSSARVGQTQTIYGTSCDFSNKLASQASSYTFQVRAKDSSSNTLKSEWAVSPEYKVSPQIAQALKNQKLGWKQNDRGWYYYYLDGSYPQNGWAEIEGKFYYFDTEGYMLTDTATPDGGAVGPDGVRIEPAV